MQSTEITVMDLRTSYSVLLLGTQYREMMRASDAISRASAIGRSALIIAGCCRLIAFLQTLELALAKTCAVDHEPDQKPQNR